MYYEDEVIEKNKGVLDVLGHERMRPYFGLLTIGSTHSEPWEKTLTHRIKAL